MNKGMIVSVEIIHLLKWIMDHGKDGLAALVTQAIAAGCLDIDENIRFDSSLNVANFQKVILEMITFFEDSIDDHVTGVAGVIPAVEKFKAQLKASKIDQGLIFDAIRMTTLHFKDLKSNGESQQEELLRAMLINFLKSWKPSKDDARA